MQTKNFDSESIIQKSLSKTPKTPSNLPQHPLKHRQFPLQHLTFLAFSFTSNKMRDFHPYSRSTNLMPVLACYLLFNIHSTHTISD